MRGKSDRHEEWQHLAGIQGAYRVTGMKRKSDMHEEWQHLAGRQPTAGLVQRVQLGRKVACACMRCWRV
jgi:hypothetical protein